MWPVSIELNWVLVLFFLQVKGSSDFVDRFFIKVFNKEFYGNPSNGSEGAGCGGRTDEGREGTWRN